MPRPSIDHRADPRIDYRVATIEDAPAICDLYVRTEAFDGVPRVLELEELVEELEGPYVDLVQNSMVAFAGGRLVGVCYLSFARAEAVQQRCTLEGLVDPEFRGQGIGRRLMRFAIDRATDVLLEIDDDLPKFIRFSAYDHIESAHRLAARMGFEPTRWFEELLRPLTDLPEPRPIGGLRIIRWPEGRDDEALVVKNTAFLDHWGSVPTPPAAWHEQLHGFVGRSDLSFVAIDESTDDIVALLVTARYESDDELLGRRDGWIQTLATLREWRGRGVGSALIVEALHAYAAAGLTHASIGVDSENPSGAAELYRHLGFELSHRTIVGQITVGRLTDP